jgi:quercetin dioxygenase-like cupin family protein
MACGPRASEAPLAKTRLPLSVRLVGGAVAWGAILIGAAVLSDRGAALPGERKVVAESRFSVTGASAQSKLVQLVVDFEPGAWTSLHTHGGQAINLVLEGEITLRQNGVDRPHRAGESWTDSSSQVHAAGNTSSGKARLLTNFLLSPGAPEITVIAESRFGPSIVYEAKFDLPRLHAEADIVQQVVDIPPGWHAERNYGGFVAAVVIDGEVTYQVGGDRKQFRDGEAFSAPAGTRITEDNRSNRSARVFISQLLPTSARLP